MNYLMGILFLGLLQTTASAESVPVSLECHRPNESATPRLILREQTREGKTVYYFWLSFHHGSARVANMLKQDPDTQDFNVTVFFKKESCKFAPPPKLMFSCKEKNVPVDVRAVEGNHDLILEDLELVLGPVHQTVLALDAIEGEMSQPKAKAKAKTKARPKTEREKLLEMEKTILKGHLAQIFAPSNSAEAGTVSEPFVYDAGSDKTNCKYDATIEN